MRTLFICEYYIKQFCWATSFFLNLRLLWMAYFSAREAEFNRNAKRIRCSRIVSTNIICTIKIIRRFSICQHFLQNQPKHISPLNSSHYSFFSPWSWLFSWCLLPVISLLLWAQLWAPGIVHMLIFLAIVIILFRQTNNIGQQIVAVAGHLIQPAMISSPDPNPAQLAPTRLIARNTQATWNSSRTEKHLSDRAAKIAMFTKNMAILIEYKNLFASSNARECP